jgi:CheY-like chemotaxis protein
MEESRMEESSCERVLVVESDDALRSSIVGALRDAGYEVSTDYREGMKSVLKFGPDAVVLGANPPQLDCCDLLSEIKGSERTRNIRVVMLSLEDQPCGLAGLISAPMMSCHCPSMLMNAVTGALATAEQTRRGGISAAGP